MLAACSSPTEEANKYYERGMVLLEQGDLAKARLEFQNALQIVNTMTNATYGLALIAEKQGEWERLYGLLNKVIDQDPKHLDAQIKLGRLLLASGEVDRALKISENAETLSPGHPDVLALHAAVLFKLDDRNGAIQQANAALAKSPNHVDALVVLATERLTANDPEKAIEYLDQALKVNEKNVALQLVKVQALQQLARTDSAEAIFRKLIAFYPETRQLRYILAQFYMAHGSRDKAEAEYRSVMTENPTDAQAKLDFVGFVHAVDGPKAATRELESLVQADPASNQLKFALASLYESQNDRAAGEKVLRGIVDQAGDSADVLKAKGQVAASRLAAGDRAAATTLITEILAQDATNEQGLFLKASMALDERKTDQAIADLRTVLRDVPNSARTLLLLGKAHELANSPELAEDHYVRALQASKMAVPYGIAYAEFLMKHRSASRAEKVLEDVLGAHPGNLDALKMMAEVRLHQGNWIGAQEVADQIRSGGDDGKISDRILGAVQAGKKNYVASIASFKRAYEASPSDVQPIVALVRTYVAAGKIDEAVTFLNSIIERNPENISARLLQGQLQIAKGNGNAAAQAFQSVIDVEPKSVLGYRNLANLHLREKRYGEADKVVAQGLAIAPKDFGLRLTQASAHEMAGRFEEAIKLYETMLKEQPNADVLANNLAALLTEHRTDQASWERAYELAQRFDRSDVPYFKDTLGWASYKVGKHQQATSLLRSAADQLPNVPVVRYHLGMNYLALADKEAARRELTRALEVADKVPFAQAEEARATLRDL